MQKKDALDALIPLTDGKTAVQICLIYQDREAYLLRHITDQAAEIAALRAALTASKEIQAAEKKILIEEIGKNATLKAERDALREKVKNMDDFQEKYFPSDVGKVCPYCQQIIKEAPHEP